MDQAAAPASRSPNVIRDSVLRKKLQTRRERLQALRPELPRPDEVVKLIAEVDAALERMDAGTFGICETCHDPVEDERMLADPLCRNCLDHLSPAEQRALERDLDLAYEIQSSLLPKPGPATDGWSVAYHYEPLGPVSGDYCDLISTPPAPPSTGGDRGGAFFFIGDVTGKGVAASMFMAQLYAIFRSLAPAAHSPGELVAKANRVFCESTLSSYFATLVGGRLANNGEVEICNAGHCMPVHVRADTLDSIQPTGLPIGLFAECEYGSQKLRLKPGESLVLYTDGLSESFNAAGEQYGTSRLRRVLEQRRATNASAIVAGLLEDVKRFRGGSPRTDDLTIMAIRREV